MNSLTLTLPWPDRRLSPNARLNWQAKLGAKQQARNVGKFAALMELDGKDLPEWMDGELCMSLTIHPPSRRRMDQDNLLASLKSTLDGVMQGFAIDDSQIKRTVIEWGELIKGGQIALRLSCKDNRTDTAVL